MQQTLKAIIIDDEVAALRTLELLLQANCPNVRLVAKGQSVDEGLSLIKQHNPDIVFLDIEMPHGSGFELIERSPNLNFDVIFITAYNQYAVKAFKYSAIDYILKPIDVDELVKAVDKVVDQRKNQIDPRERYSVLFDTIKELLPRKLVLPTEDGFNYIDLNSVLFVDVKPKSVRFYIFEAGALEFNNNIDNIEAILNDKGFTKTGPHRFVNLNKVLKIDKLGKGMVVLEGNHFIELELISKDDFIKMLTAYNSKNA